MFLVRQSVPFRSESWGTIGLIAARAVTRLSTVHHFSYSVGFLFLAAVAAVALGILYFFMPETRDKQFLIPSEGAATA